MLASEIDGDRAVINRMLRAFEHIRLVTSLGGVATTINHPVSTSHRDVDDDTRARSGAHPGLLRLPDGIEAADDLRAGVTRGLSAAIRRRAAAGVASGASAAREGDR
jgi:cystathionine beta-lyase/cystathionine gamma-synthase